MATPLKSKNCVLIGEKYLPQSLGSTVVCIEVRREIAAQAPSVAYEVDITVLSPSRLSAVSIVNGRKLPEHKFAVMDDNFSPDSVKRFAKSLAAEIAEAGLR